MHLLASVIIPVYNQFDSLIMVLGGFNRQNASPKCYEIIVISDGSDDGLENETSETIRRYYKGDITLIHQTNKGRAAARNAGINLSRASIIIFCDGDRVPHENFVAEHIATHQKNKSGNIVVLGFQYDYFGNKKLLESIATSKNEIVKLLRTPNYFKRISSIYTENKTTSNLSWLSFLVGNTSVSKNVFDKIGLFDEIFVEWGFEHFELGLRMQNNNTQFLMNPKAMNYHIVHPREARFYKDMMKKSSNILYKKHPYINIRVMQEFLLTNLNPILIENKIFNNDRETIHV